MSRLDEIQATLADWRELEPQNFVLSDIGNLVIVLTDIVSELKRIDAERKAMDKVLVDLLAKDTQGEGT